MSITVPRARKNPNVPLRLLGWLLIVLFGTGALVGVVLCFTIVLLPIGLPVMLGSMLFLLGGLELAAPGFTEVYRQIRREGRQ